MTDEEYKRSERLLLMRQLERVEAQPLPDRQAARADYAKYLQDPELVAERTCWLLLGSYGYGAMVHALEIARNRRMNRAAAIGRLLAALDCQCPASFSVQAYKSLTPNQQSAVDSAIVRAIAKYFEDQENV